MVVRSERWKPHLLHRARKSSKCLHVASNDVPITALGDIANGLHLLRACHIWVRPCVTRSVGYHERVELGADSAERSVCGGDY